jgi:hypothetical protein
MRNDVHVTTACRAEQTALGGLESKVTCQCRVACVDLPLAARQNGVCHCPRIIPPDFFRHATKELKRLSHAFQNRLGPLSRERDRKRSVRIRPHQNQHVDLATSVGKVDLNLAEVSFHTLARIMIQRNERLAFRLTMLLHKATHRIVAALVTVAVTVAGNVFVPQPLEATTG